MKPSIAVIIPTFNNKSRLYTALTYWAKVLYENFTIIVVNDGCSDSTKEMIEINFPHAVQLFGDGNLWFAGSVNMGLKYAQVKKFDYATVFNDDNYVESDILSAQIECAQRFPDAIIGIRSYKLGTEKMIWSVGGRITRRLIGLGITFMGRNCLDDGKTYEDYFEVDVLDGSGQFYPIHLIQKIGYWDARYLTYYADVEYSLRAKHRGIQVVTNPNAIAWHDYEESDAAKRNIKNYKFRLFHLLLNNKSSYNIVNMCRFWFTYYPLRAPFTILRYYAVMLYHYYIPVRSNRKRILR